MYTFQDFENDKNSNGLSYAVQHLINHHQASDDVKIAKNADLYDKQRNITINEYVRFLYSADGSRYVDKTGANNKLCSSFFRRLNTQRMSYSLGNGVTFETEGLKERLGIDFDTKLRNAGYLALIHGVSFMFFNMDHIHVFPITEFAPLWDEETGELRAGLRYWQIDSFKPIMAIYYETDGYTRLIKGQEDDRFTIVEDKRGYRMQLAMAEADAEPEVIAEENYNGLPIVPLYGSRLKQSTLVGMRSQIDAYDLVRSGFANDLTDCSEIYWLINNAGGMNQKDLETFRNRLKLQHVAVVSNADEVSVTPYTQEIPFNARKTFLDDIRSGIYEDFGGLDVHTIAAGSTNDHIDAAYQPLDENADDYEYEIIQAVQSLLALIDEYDTPIFKRNRISNMKEQVDMVMECANYLDDETILKKLPFITPDEVKAILEKKDIEELDNFNSLMDRRQEEVMMDE